MKRGDMVLMKDQGAGEFWLLILEEHKQYTGDIHYLVSYRSKKTKQPNVFTLAPKSAHKGMIVEVFKQPDPAIIDILMGVIDGN